jgi:hypothetical protein
VPPRRFPPPWSVEDISAAYVVKDGSGQQLAYVYYEEEPGRQSAAKLLTKDEAHYCGVYLSRPRRPNGGLVVLKTLAKLIFGIAAIAAATSFGTSTSRAYGDAPWCAVITIGTGTVYWDCQYPTFEACYHLGNILAGNKGFCNLNPWPGPSQAVPYKLKRHPRY